MLDGLVLLASLALSSSSKSTCDGSSIWSSCTVSASGSSVDVSGSRGGGGGAGGSGGSGAVGGEVVEDAGEDVCDNVLGRCDLFEVVSRPEPTLADVASFAPEVAPLVPEPAGVGVVGMPVNVVAAAAEHTREGELFDLPVRVRFQPQSFLFDYGDGTTRDSPTGGRTWNQLGAAQLTPTPTSHVYDHRGTYTARVTIRFRADVDFGNGWTRVPGLLDIPAHTTRITILEAHTALVQHTCHETPHAPGC